MATLQVLHGAVVPLAPTDMPHLVWQTAWGLLGELELQTDISVHCLPFGAFTGIQYLMKNMDLGLEDATLIVEAVLRKDARSVAEVYDKDAETIVMEDRAERRELVSRSYAAAKAADAAFAADTLAESLLVARQATQNMIDTVNRGPAAVAAAFGVFQPDQLPDTQLATLSEDDIDDSEMEQERVQTLAYQAVPSVARRLDLCAV